MKAAWYTNDITSSTCYHGLLECSVIMVEADVRLVKSKQVGTHKHDFWLRRSTTSLQELFRCGFRSTIIFILNTDNVPRVLFAILNVWEWFQILDVLSGQFS